ncbi:hypothetical protein ACIHDR_44400 [Nocardia sp. NPDC052278]|uniref:hypothetical protein n=1 Tax=unclassified Nocardia TaxID=2637762 RepID=UPI00367E3B4E
MPDPATGRCASWDGIITGETATDYPSVRPEYEPRGAALSWCTYSPNRVGYPYTRACSYECIEKHRNGDPVTAWAEIQADPILRR